MSDIPKLVHINEEGPREGFQYEKAHIPTARKIEFIDMLARTGVRHIQIVSFVNPKAVPGMADAEEVVRGVSATPDVSFIGLWLNQKGLERAIETGKLTIKGNILLSASALFLKRNQECTPAEQVARQHSMIEVYQQHGISVERMGVMAAFGCNFEGDIPADRVLELIKQQIEIATAHNINLKRLFLADTMGWATPLAVKRLVGRVQDRYPDLEIILHLHDTRGMGIANAMAGLEMGVSHYDSSVAGLGGCPFAGHQGAAGRVH